MKKVYLSLAIAGAVVPYLFFFDFMQEFGLNLSLFISSAFINGAAAGLGADLLISSFVFWLFMFQRHRGGNGPGPILFIVLNLTIGMSCALPAYLYAVEKRKTSLSS